MGRHTKFSRSTHATAVTMLLGATCTSNETHYSCWSPQFPQLAASLSVTEPFHRQFLSRFYGRKIPIEIKKKYVGVWDPAEVATKRLRNASNYIRNPRRRLFFCLWEHLASRYSARAPLLRVYIEAFLKRSTRRFHNRSSFAPRKTYTIVLKFAAADIRQFYVFFGDLDLNI
jgi:hypothetical protein